MPAPKTFLLDECENIGRSLSESLRHEYGADQGLAFFKECVSRLDALRLATQSTPDSDVTSLGELSAQLSALSALIGRIERSHRGEFSWAFSLEIERLGESICRDSTGQDPSKNLFFFGSDGGLGAYCIYPEQLPMHLASARIYSVNFPRTLKHHVLLHAILGHELGHAALDVPEVKNRANAAIDLLRQVGPLSDVGSFRAWLGQLIPVPVLDDAAVQRIIDSWLTEFFCDLFGLVAFGPAFVGAHDTLLRAVDPSGSRPGDFHPPGFCRFRLVKVALDHLGWNSYCDGLMSDAGVAGESMWPSHGDPNLNLAWVDLIPDNQVRLAVDALNADPTRFGGSFYALPNQQIPIQLAEQLLLRIPPLPVQTIDDGSISLPSADFRDTLLAGWLGWRRTELAQGADSLTFFEINRLCDHAILQSQAVARQASAMKPKAP